MTAIRLASRVTRIKPSPSTAANDRARALRAQGRDIVELVIGEPDFDTPDHIKQAACNAIEQGDTKYTAVPGTVPLREAISAKMQAQTGIKYGLNQITVSHGAKQIIFNALAATVEEGTEVIVPAPYWVSYPDMVLCCGGKPIIVPCSEADEFKLTASALEAAITPGTRWLILNSPSNPTGSVYTRQELRALTDVLLRHPNVWVLTDDIYNEIRFTDDELITIVSAEPRMADRTMLVNGVSKTYAMTGWRIGYGVGPAGLVNAMNTLQSQMSSCASSVSQAAAVAALTGDQAFTRKCAAVYAERSRRAAQLLNQIPGLRCLVPTGAFYVYPSCEGVIGKRTPDGKMIETDNDFVLYLLDTEGVAVISGAAYGLSPYFRVSVATSMETIEKGCARIARACGRLV
jgi:aspartate aminotransferase